MNNKTEMMRTDHLETQEPFNTIFPIQDMVVKKITAHMEKDGFDSAHPISVWMTDKPIVLDGHTRLQVARSLGIQEVPVVIKEFDDIADAFDYAVSQQVERRNISIADMVRYIEVADKLAKRGRKKLEPNGSNFSEKQEPKGKSSERLADTLHIAPKRAERLRRVVRDGSEETKKAMCAGKISLNKAYDKTLAQMAAKKADDEGEQSISPEEKIKLAKKIRLKTIPENVISAIAKEIKTEKTHYPALCYNEKQIAAMKDTILNGLDAILNELAQTQLN